jgi:hypothetical protein
LRGRDFGDAGGDERSGVSAPPEAGPGGISYSVSEEGSGVGNLGAEFESSRRRSVSEDGFLENNSGSVVREFSENAGWRDGIRTVSLRFFESASFLFLGE